LIDIPTKVEMYHRREFGVGIKPRGTQTVRTLRTPWVVDQGWRQSSKGVLMRYGRCGPACNDCISCRDCQPVSDNLYSPI